MTSAPPVREMIKQAIAELGGSATYAQMRGAIVKHYPEVNPSTINAQIIACTVNAPSRIHYYGSTHERSTFDPRYDILFSDERGHVVAYDPDKHGHWEIAKDADGRLQVVKAGDTPTVTTTEDGDGEDGQPEGAQAHFLFSLERHLRDFLAANVESLDVTGAPLSLYVNDMGQSGVEYPTSVGPIDILAVDANGDFVVFELKLGRGPDAAVGQITRYMGWVKQQLAGEHTVRGIIVAQTLEDKLRYAASVIPNVSLYEYTVSFTLQAAGELGST